MRSWLSKEELRLTSEVNKLQGKPEAARNTAVSTLVITYFKMLIYNTLQLYLDTKNPDYLSTLRALLSVFDKKNLRLTHGIKTESREIANIVLADLYEDIAPNELARLIVDDLPKYKADVIKSKNIEKWRKNKKDDYIA